MSEKKLRQSLVRLAESNPSLRPHLVPLLRKKGASSVQWKLTPTTDPSITLIVTPELVSVDQNPAPGGPVSLGTKEEWALSDWRLKGFIKVWCRIGIGGAWYDLENSGRWEWEVLYPATRTYNPRQELYKGSFKRLTLEKKDPRMLGFLSDIVEREMKNPQSLADLTKWMHSQVW